MKHLIVLLGITACLVAPLSAQNDSGDAQQGARIVRVKAKSTAQARAKSRCVYYITNVTTAGSHIPLVVRRYKGEDSVMYQASHGKGYNAGDIGLTGSLNVQGALTELDPAISSVAGRGVTR